jgi:hypothetical protein
MNNQYRDKTTGRYTTSPATRSQQLYTELYRAFDFFNEYFAENKLPKVVITVQESGRRNAYGWFGNAFWTDRQTGDAVPEINLSAEYLSRGSSGLLETLLHEMAHLWNASVADVRDCPDGRYHNKKFKSAAEQFGLEVKRDGSRGWAYTRLTDESRKAIEELKPLEDAFKTLRRKSIQAKPERYMSLIIDAELKDTLKTAITKSSMSQREFVETAIESAIEYWSNRGDLS